MSKLTTRTTLEAPPLVVPPDVIRECGGNPDAPSQPATAESAGYWKDEERVTAGVVLFLADGRYLLFPPEGQAEGEGRWR